MNKYRNEMTKKIGEYKKKGWKVIHKRVSGLNTYVHFKKNDKYHYILFNKQFKTGMIEGNTGLITMTVPF